MLINLSNHPSAKWKKSQCLAAEEKYGKIIDTEFPAVDPGASTEDVAELARQYLAKVMALIKDKENDPQPHAVHIQGEFTFVYKLVTLLKGQGITCVASTARRNVKELANGEKIVKFDFVRFREY